MLVIAHRGASDHAPENTLLAIDKAIAMQADAIEVDVFWADGELILLHDRWLQRTTNGHGRVDRLSLTRLRQLNAGKGQQIPTLYECLRQINGRCDVNLELKNSAAVIPVLTAIDYACSHLNFRQEQFLVSAFNHHWLHFCKQRSPWLRLGALTASVPLDYAAFASRLQAWSVHMDIDFICPAFIKDAHRRGLQVFVYTVDEPEDIADMLNLGVDGIFTNNPTRSLITLAHLQRTNNSLP